MSLYLKQFNTHAEYDSYINGSGAILPNVSICTTEGDVHYNPTVRVSGVTLDKSTLSLNKGETETLIATVLPSNASNKNVTWTSSNDSVATVSNNGLVTAVGDSGYANITVTTVDGGHTAQCAIDIISTIYGHEYVEIGGLKWATKNVGALTVTDYGLYFAWGDTKGYTADQVTGSTTPKKNFSWSDYKYGGMFNLTKYNDTDGKMVLENTDDAVTKAWGGSWRMPTSAEFAALGAATDFIDSSGTTITASNKLTTLSGVTGILVADKNNHSKRLFFPAAGTCGDGSVFDVGSYGNYWSSLCYHSSMTNAKELIFSSSFVYWEGHSYRYYGFPVRGVVG